MPYPSARACLVDVGGIEPPYASVSCSCLTTWRYVHCDGVTDRNRTGAWWDTTTRDYHYTTATMSALGQIRTDTVQALILAPPAVGLRAHTLSLPCNPTMAVCTSYFTLSNLVKECLNRHAQSN